MVQTIENDSINPKVDLLWDKVQVTVTSSLFDIFKQFFLRMILHDVISNFSSQIKGWLRVENHQNSNMLEVASWIVP